MVDLFALLLTHGLIALAVLRLLGRADLDEDPAIPRDPPMRAKKRADRAAAPRREMILPGQPMGQRAEQPMGQPMGQRADQPMGQVAGEGGDAP